MAFAALISGITLTSAGLGAVHGFAAPLGANFPVPHGVVCAALLPHVISANRHAMEKSGGCEPSLARYGEIEQIVPNLATFAESLRIPKLSSFGLTRERIPEMVALARKASSMRYNPVTLSDEALAKVLEDAL
jgi:alcohol dehydrogenase class IV